jgi:ketosteroid isomerase-like protein
MEWDMNTRDTVQAYFNSLKEKGDWKTFLADEMVFTSLGTPAKQLRGRDAYLESTKRFYSMIDALEIRDILVDGAKACVLTKYDLQPPGRPMFESNVAEIFEVREGKITSLRIYFDSAPFPK